MTANPIDQVAEVAEVAKGISDLASTWAVQNWRWPSLTPRGKSAASQ